MELPFGLWVLAHLAMASMAFAETQEAVKASWHALMTEGKVNETERLCQKYLKSTMRALVSEAHQCLASVEVRRAMDKPLVTMSPDEDGGGELRQSYDSANMKRAVKHLGQAISATPQDLAIHQGRIHILINYGSGGAAPEALRRTLETLKPKPAVDLWLVYAKDFKEHRLYRTAVRFFQVVDRFYPNNFRVVADLGAFATLSKDDTSALTYLQRAIALDNRSFNAHWNLGQLYQITGRVTEAASAFEKAFALEPRPDEHPDEFCAYATFLEDKVKDAIHAKKIRDVGCKK